jgi:sideroflexin-5
MTTTPFSLTKSRFDQSTFLGRFYHNLDLVDPRTLLVTKEGLKREQELLEAYKKLGKLPAGKTDDDLWWAKKVRDSMVHPDSGEVIPRPFRMSGCLRHTAVAGDAGTRDNQ